MKKLIIVFFICVFTNCAKYDEIKEVYIDQKAPFLKDNLTEQELILFKKSMEFNKENALISWDMMLLEKGAKDHFDSIMVNITSEMGGNISNIIIIDTLGHERRINSSRYAVESIEGATYTVNELNANNVIFLITSTTCGYCVQFFEKANKIGSDVKFSNFKFVALFGNSLETIELYKNGSVFKTFGFLNDSWIKFSKEKNIIKDLNLNYLEKEDGYPVFFYKKNGKFLKNRNVDELEEILINLNR